MMNKSKILSSILFTVFGILLTVISILMFIRPSSAIAHAAEPNPTGFQCRYGTYFTLKEDIQFPVQLSYQSRIEGSPAYYGVSANKLTSSAITPYSLEIICCDSAFTLPTIANTYSRVYPLRVGYSFSPPTVTSNSYAWGNYFQLFVDASVSSQTTGVSGSSTVTYSVVVSSIVALYVGNAIGYGDPSLESPSFDGQFSSSTIEGASGPVFCCSENPVYFSSVGYAWLSEFFDIHTLGESAGEYEQGYQDGLNKGQSDSFVNPLVQALVPVHNFLETDFFGVSLADFLSVVIFVCLAIIFLRLFAGG